MKKKFLFILAILLTLTMLFILTVFFTLSRHEPRSCVNSDLMNKIIVKGFSNLTTENTTLYRFKDVKNDFENIEIKKIRFQNHKEVSGYGETYIITEESLFSQENYRLVINEINYDITDIKILPKVIMKGMLEENECNVQSFKINNKEAQIIYNHVMLTFHKPK